MQIMGSVLNIRGISEVLLCGETKVPGESPPVWPGHHKPSHELTLGLNLSHIGERPEN